MQFTFSLGNSIVQMKRDRDRALVITLVDAGPTTNYYLLFSRN